MIKKLILLAGLLIFSGYLSAERSRINLDGTWQFRLDPRNQGETEGWPSGQVASEDAIQVPGSWQAQGFGEPAGILRHHYAGKAWYLKRVPVPLDWKGKVVRLRIGGAHRRTRLFVNGAAVGEEYDGFSAPFAFDVTSAIRPGEDNFLALRLDNSGPAVEKGPREQEAPLPVGMLNYITNWGGIYGHVDLEASAYLRIDSVYVRPDLASQTARFVVTVENRNPSSRTARVRVAVSGEAAESTVQVSSGASSEVSVELPMPGARLWSPEDPYLYRAELSLTEERREVDRLEQRFGFREISTRGSVLLLNGKPLYLRGYGDDNIEVLGGLPPASRETYLERLRRAKSFGFNAVRFHSMTPAPGFFEAADEVGILVMAELPAAYTQYFLPHREFLRRELRAVLLAHRNHPSLLSLALGNEFNLDWLKGEAERTEFLASVAEFYEEAKRLAPATLIMSNDGFIMKPTDMASIFRGSTGEMPIVRHEFGGYYCSLPDTALIDRFTGAIVPTWLEAKKRWVEENGLLDRYPEYVGNSQRLQQLGRKFQIERVRRDPNATGYHYWLIVDFPGGTGEGDSWEEGWFNYFWEPKNIEPREGRGINSRALLMVGAEIDQRTMWSEGSRTIDLYLSNYGELPVRDGTVRWRLDAGGNTLMSGSDRVEVNVALGQVARIGRVRVGPVSVPEALKASLVVELASQGSALENSWDFWVFPRQGLTSGTDRPVFSRIRREALRRLYPFLNSEGDPEPGALLITSSLDPDAAAHLRGGGRVWIMAGRNQFSRSGDGRFFAESGGAIGTIVEDHPALEGFPTEGFCDLQFYNLLEGSWNFSLDRWPQGLTPIIGALRTQASFLSQRKDLTRTGYLFEARVGAGRLLVTTLRLEELLDEAYPEAIYLFDRLLRYTSGPDFAPSVAIGEEQLGRLQR